MRGGKERGVCRSELGSPSGRNSAHSTLHCFLVHPVLNCPHSAENFSLLTFDSRSYRGYAVGSVGFRVHDTKIAPRERQKSACTSSQRRRERTRSHSVNIFLELAVTMTELVPHYQGARNMELMFYLRIKIQAWPTRNC